MFTTGNIIAKLTSMLACSTFYLQDDNIVSDAESGIAQVISDSPWKHLEVNYLVPSSDKCAILALESLEDYNLALYSLKKTRLKVSLALLSRNSSMWLSPDDYHPDFKLGLVNKKNDDGKDSFAYQTISPFDKHGKAKKRQVIVSHLEYPPFITKSGLNPAGSDIDVMDSLSSRLGLTIKHKEAQTFNELVSFVANGNADMCVTHLGIVLHRYRMGLDPVELGHTIVYFAQRYPVPLNSHYTISHPFTVDVWFALIATTLLVCLFLGFLNR